MTAVSKKRSCLQSGPNYTPPLFYARRWKRTKPLLSSDSGGILITVDTAPPPNSNLLRRYNTKSNKITRLKSTLQPSMQSSSNREACSNINGDLLIDKS